MIKVNLKRTLLSATIVLSAALTPGQAIAQYHEGTDLLYIYYYFSDSSYLDLVGSDRDTCNWYGVGRTATNGTATSYIQTDPWAYCVDGQLAPY